MPNRTTHGMRRMLGQALGVAFAASAFSAGVVLGAVPGNDLRQDATHISVLGLTLTGNTTDATSAGEPVPSCGSSVGKTVWFRYRASIPFNLTADTGGSDFDTVLQVYVATASGLSKVKCNDDAFGPSTPAAVSFKATAGKLYYFQLGGYGAETGNYEFFLYGRPLNDTFATPAVAKTLPFSYQEGTSGATGQVGEPLGCGTKAHSVWFKYRPKTTAPILADTYGSDFDTLLAVYVGTSMGSLSLIACIDNSGGTPQSQLTWIAVGGDTYYMQVTGATSLTAGNLIFTLTRN